MTVATESTTPVRHQDAVPLRSWRTRLAFWLCQRRPKNWSRVRLIRLFQRCHSELTSSVIVGLLRPTEMDDIVAEGYRQNVAFYDSRTYDRSHDSQLIGALQEHKTAGRLLDAFCGQGREAQLLADAGYTVTGLDNLQPMIDGARSLAAENGFEAEFILGDFQRFQPDQAFDVVYTSIWMYSTLQSRSRRIRFLQKCVELCRPDGVVVVSFDPRQNVAPVRMAEHMLVKTIAFLTGGNRHAEPDERFTTGGLFWQCHEESRVVRETQTVGMELLEIVHSDDNKLTALLLRPTSSVEALEQESANV